MGGGIAGLVCALYLQREGFRVTLIESSGRLGGQIKTTVHSFGDTQVPIEEGAEGYVARSTLFPEIAKILGIKDRIVRQDLVTDNELSSDYKLTPLAPGMAAHKLGFQVRSEDKGKGIHSFCSGMIEVVDAIEDRLRSSTDSSACLPVQILFNTTVCKVRDHGNSFLIHTKSVDQTLVSAPVLETDDFEEKLFGKDGEDDRLDLSSFSSVVFAIPPESIANFFGFPEGSVPKRNYNSHVSVHLAFEVVGGEFAEEEGNELVPSASEQVEIKPATPKIPCSSFTLPPDMQLEWFGLRAVSCVNEKFPDRVKPTEKENRYSTLSLFRLYFRPTVEGMKDSDYLEISARLLKQVLGLDEPMGVGKVSRWSAALPEFPAGWSVEEFQKKVSRGNACMQFAGSANYGAGLEVAASSGKRAAEEIVKAFRGSVTD